MTALYQLQHIQQRYGRRTVLALEELQITRGETLALIGPSGAGKSTLLRLLCFLELPTTGTIMYANAVVPHRPPLSLQREVTMVFQRPLLLDASVRTNVTYGLSLRGIKDDERVEVILRQLGLAELAHARAQTLSGGELQRVAVARALVLQLKVLLLDEPTANLDPHNVALIEQAIVAHQQRYNTTIVLATHNLHQARRLTNRTALLLDGQLIEMGSTEQVLGSPQDTRTQAFVSGGMVF